MDFILNKFSHRFRQSKSLGAVFTSNILLSFHYYLIVYINSSFLSNFFSASQISVFYIVGALIQLLVFINISKILEKIGTYKLIWYAIIMEIIAVFGLAFTAVPVLIAIYFIIHQLCTPTISFGLDILLESQSPDESKTGKLRGIYLTLANITLVLAPALVAFILTDGDYYKVYLTSLLFIISCLFTVKKYFKNFKDSTVKQLKIRETIQDYLKDKDLENVFTAHFFLQIFYSYMVIYTPVYLSQYMGFNWEEIGIMFTIVLLPFILFEFPVGKLADTTYGETEMMTIGFVLMGIFTLLISFITSTNFWLWTFILFMTRAGASIVEITTDAYFFKKVGRDDANIIGVYRMGNPLSFIVAPILATLSLQFMAYHNIFIVLGALMIFGCHYALTIHDTR